MKSLNKIIIIFALSIIYISFNDCFFILEEGKQAVITQFGRPVGRPITEAGMHFKLPFIQKNNEFEKRILIWEGDPNQIPTKDKKYIWVETTARWRINDALVFLQTNTNYQVAYSRMDDIIDAVVRDIVSSNPLIEVVRSQTLKKDTKKENQSIYSIDNSIYSEETNEEISLGRDKITRIILEESKKLVSRFGIELIDVRLKRINYIETVRNKVYQRMISERKRIASGYRSEGEGKKAGIIGQMEKELQEIKSEAYKKAQIIQGEADAKATQIYGEAYNEDPEFYAFYKTLETYSQLKNDNSYLVLSTDSDLYKYLKKIH
ncbi:MAG: protease modulator HflC [Candidatus Firestonebacteria bacterium]|nr:protease modulator HflC [Candidatus Firestonebacteria bacterium]